MHTSSAEEYGFTPEPPNNGNGHKGKVFNLTRAPDPETQAILAAREEALHDKRLRGSFGKFILLAIERSAQHRYWRDHGKGIICMADSVAAQILGVTERTIYTYRHHEATADYFWFTKKWRPDKWAMMTYHLCKLHPPPQDKGGGWEDEGGCYAGGSKPRPPEPPDGAAAIGRTKRNAALQAKRAQKTLPLVGGLAVVPPAQPPPTGSFKGPKLPKSSVFRRISAECRLVLRRTAEMHFGSQPKPASADSRNPLRLTAETHIGSGPKSTAADSRNAGPPSAEAACRHSKAKDQDLVSDPIERQGEWDEKHPRPQVIFKNLIKQHPGLWPWLNTLPGTYRSKLEKEKAEIEGKREKAAPNQKPFFTAQIKAINYYLKGEPPAPELVKAAPVKEPTQAERDAEKAAADRAAALLQKLKKDL